MLRVVCMAFPREWGKQRVIVRTYIRRWTVFFDLVMIFFS